MAAAGLALVPIVAGIIDGDAGPSHTAFASAPAGDYAVIAASTDTVDVIRVVRAGGPAEGDEIARVDHLSGFYSTGSVSPDGRLLALVTVDAGTPAAPGASLLTVDLETAAVTRLAVAVTGGQRPAWTPDSRAIAITRPVTDAATPAIAVSRVPVDLSGAKEVDRLSGALGLYLVGFDPAGRLLSVAIDGRGSTLRRDGAELRLISTFATRDWRLSPDGSQVAFIESDTSAGLRYVGRVVAVEGESGGGVSAQGLTSTGQQLGAAWPTAGAGPAFGQEPAPGAVRAAGVGPGGFDIPLAFAPTGGGLFVQHWSGESFAEPGQLMLTVVAGDQRLSLPDATAFYGWARR